MSTSSTRLLALLGHPVAHSLSPAMMTHVCARLGIDAVYVACDVSPDALRTAVEGLRSLGALGANVTLPHKRAVLSLCTTCDAFSRISGAVNTLHFEGATVHGANTDASAVLASLREVGFEAHGCTVVVLGSGGAACAVVAALALARVREIVVVGRGEEAQQRVAVLRTSLRQGGTTTTLTSVSWHDDEAVRGWMARAELIVQATPVGMTGFAADPVLCVPWLSAARVGACAMDLVYRPRTTPWLCAARDRGLLGVDGLGMLAFQAREALEIWTGTRADVDLFRSFLDDATRSG